MHLKKEGEVMREMGRVNIHLSDEIIRDGKRFSDEKGISFSSMTEILWRMFLKKDSNSLRVLLNDYSERLRVVEKVKR